MLSAEWLAEGTGDQLLLAAPACGLRGGPGAEPPGRGDPGTHFSSLLAGPRLGQGTPWDSQVSLSPPQDCADPPELILSSWDPPGREPRTPHSPSNAPLRSSALADTALRPAPGELSTDISAQTGGWVPKQW